MSSDLMRMSPLERNVVTPVRMIGAQWEERLRAEALCRTLLEGDARLTEAFKNTILADLRSKRLFSLIEPMAERLLTEGFSEQPALKAYAQALIEKKS